MTCLLGRTAVAAAGIPPIGEGAVLKPTDRNFLVVWCFCQGLVTDNDGSFAMNCSLVIDLLPELLLYLSNYPTIRGLVVYSEPFCLTRVRKIIGNGVFLAGDEKNTTFTDQRLTYVFSKLPVESTSQDYENASKNVLIENWRQDNSAKVAVLDSRSKKWVLKNFGPRVPFLRRSMQNVTVSIALTTFAGISDTESIRRFASSLGALYWSILIGHYKFRIRYKIIVRPAGDQSFNSVRYTMRKFLTSDVDTISDLFLISAERVEKLSFILIGLEVKYHFIIRRPEYEYSWLAVIRPLAPSLWWGIGGMIIAIGFFLGFVFRHAGNAPLRPNSLTGVFLAFGISCSQVKFSGLRGSCTQLVFLTALNFFSSINQFYVSNLYSMLATREIHYPFNTIEEFVERKTHKMAISPDTSVYSAFQAAKNKIFRRVWEDFLVKDPSHVINETNIAEIVERVCDGTTTLFALPLQVARFASESCPFFAIPRGYFPNNMGIAARKDFPYLPHFQSLFLRTMESGISKYLKKKYVMAILPDLKKRDLSLDPAPVTMQQVFLIFVLLVVSIIISFVILFIEKNIYKNTKTALKRKNRLKL